MTNSLNRATAAFVLAAILGGCGVTPSVTPSPAPAIGAGPITTPEAAAADAMQQVSIRGPFNVGEVRQGTYADLWAGSTNNALGGPGTNAPDPDLVVWRIDLTGPTGQEQVYLDAATGKRVDSIVQGQ